MEPESATSGASGLAEIDSPAVAAQGMASDVAAGQGVRDALGAAVGVLNDVAEQVDPGGFATIVDAAPRSPHSASAAVVEVDGAAIAAEQPVTSAASQAADRLLANSYVAMTDGRGQRAAALDVQGLAADLIDMNADEPALATSTYTAVVERIGPALGRQLDAAIHDAAQPRLEPYPGGRQFHADEIAIIQGAAPGFRDYLSRYGVDLTVPEAERVLAQSAYRTINPAGPDAEALSPEDMARFGGEGTRFLGLQVTPSADEVLHRTATDFLRGEMRAQGVSMPLEADPVHADAGRMFHFMPAHEAAGNVTEVYAGTLETHADFYVENNLYRDIEGGPERLAEHQRIAEFMERGTIAAPFIATGVVAVGLAPTALTAVLANPATTTEVIIAGAEVAAGDALGASTLAPIVAPAAVVGSRYSDDIIDGIDTIADVLRSPAITIDGFDALAAERLARGLPTAGSVEDAVTLARIEVGGDVFYGISRGAQDPVTDIRLDRVNAQTRTHAEADVVQQLLNSRGQLNGGRIEMYVDRDLCRACGQNGGMRSLARNLGVDEIVVHSPSGTQVFFPTR